MTKNKQIIIRLKSLFEKMPVDLVYLYGSRAKELADRFSDYDFAVLFSGNLNKDEKFDLRLKLFSEIGRSLQLKEEEMDIVDMEEVSILLQFNIISGKVIYCRNEKRRVGFESFVLGRYHDEHYYYDRMYAETLEKIRKGVYFERRLSYA